MSSIKNWYFCLSQGTKNRHNHDWLTMAKVAVRSCKKYTTLQPNLLYTGTQDDVTEALEREGVNVIYHTSSLQNELYRKYKNNEIVYNIALGAFLRFEIPVITGDHYALYADTDIIFNSGLSFNSELNKINNFLAAPQMSQDDYDNDMNSGVLLMNLEHMRSIYFELIDFAKTEIKNNAGDILDQDILRLFFPRNKRSDLPAIYNWKPYWGFNLEAAIIHFHGPKPMHIKKILFSDGVIESIFEELYNRDKESYLKYLQLFDSYLTEDEKSF